MGWTDERTNGRTGKRTNERKTVVAKANCETLCKLFNRNANSTYCMIYGQPRRFSDLVPRQAVVKCTFVMYIIKLIVRFFLSLYYLHRVSMCKCMSLSVSISVSVFLGFKQFFFRSISYFVSFHFINTIFSYFWSVCAIWTFNMHCARVCLTIPGNARP